MLQPGMKSTAGQVEVSSRKPRGMGCPHCKQAMKAATALRMSEALQIEERELYKGKCNVCLKKLMKTSLTGAMWPINSCDTPKQCSYCTWCFGIMVCVRMHSGWVGVGGVSVWGGSLAR